MAWMRRWLASPLVPLLILLIAAGWQYLLWMERNGDRTEQILSIWMVWFGTGILLLVWWLLLSPASGGIRLKVVATHALAFVLLLLTFRVEGVSGDLVPSLVPRWHSEAEARTATYLENRPTAEIPVSKSLQVDDGDWPAFRGLQRDGVVRGTRLRRNWTEQPPPLVWRHPVGPAWSSFAVVDDLAYTQEQRGEQETIVCYDMASGREVWSHGETVRFSTATGGVGPLSTPSVDGQRVYTVGPTGNLRCLHAVSGELLWRRDVFTDTGLQPLEWGLACSPLVYREEVIVCPGGDETHSTGLCAYNRVTGQPVWKYGVHPASYSSPVVRTINGTEWLLIVDGHGIAGHEPGVGHELWRLPWANTSQIHAAIPFIRSDGAVAVSVGYGTGTALMKLTCDETRRHWKAERADWDKSKQFKLKFNDGVQQGDYVYGLDEGILACFDLQTGRRVWKGGRYGYGQLLLIEEENLLLVLTEQGEAVLVEASPKEHVEVARFQALNGKTWNVPVVVHGKLLVRNAEEAACYDLRPEESK